jgi:hypothetical protein
MITHPPSSPALLGRFGATQHRHLHGLNARLKAMCDALSADPSLPFPPELEPSALIGEWSVELSGHFADEEGIRYFGTLATERPALVATIADLCVDHEQMLEEIEALTLIAADPARRGELLSGTQALMAHLRVHESAENAMLKEFFDDTAHSET